MELSKLINSMRVTQVTGEVERKDISAVVYDSRKVVKGSVFFAIKGLNSDGHEYIIDAMNKGALAVVLEDDKRVPDEIFLHKNITKILVSDSRKALADFSHFFYKSPTHKLKLIGVTGTNGKTTTTYILRSILEYAGYKSGLIGTIANYIGDRKIATEMTTPESTELSEMFNDMIIAGCSFAVMEVSSHALTMQRVSALNFKGGIFTNLTHDHLDFHETFENYRDAKKKLFDMLDETAFACVNIDDTAYSEMVRSTKAKVFTYGKHPSADYKIENLSYSIDGTILNVRTSDRYYKVTSPLIGEFNAYNIAGAMSAAFALGISSEAIIDGIKNAPQVPGRFEVLRHSDKTVIIDYAHTPDSLEKTISNLRKIIRPEQRIITVFGCGGDRDKTKRPIMGKIATSLSDEVIITSDNPRFENPIDIINDITKGIVSGNYSVVPDREEAIREAIKKADTNTFVLICGKGHEDYQSVQGVKRHFSDKECSLKYMEVSL